MHYNTQDNMMAVNYIDLTKKNKHNNTSYTNKQRASVHNYARAHTLSAENLDSI